MLAMVINKRLMSNPIAFGIVESILKISFPILIKVHARLVSIIRMTSNDL